MKESLQDYHCPHCRRTRHSISISATIGLCIVTATIFTTIALTVVVQGAILSSAELSFARTFTSFEKVIPYVWTDVKPDAWSDYTYSYTPSIESDQAWEELQAVRGTLLTDQEVAEFHLPTDNLKVNKSGKRLTATVLGVQHNLHCLRIIRQTLYPNHYYPNKTASDDDELLFHAGHCLEHLRQSVMCVADLTPRVVYWEDELRMGIALDSTGRSQCVDWETFVRWEQPRGYRIDHLWRDNPVLAEDEQDDAGYKYRKSSADPHLTRSWTGKKDDTVG